jgi:hypothetical protein
MARNREAFGSNSAQMLDVGRLLNAQRDGGKRRSNGKYCLSRCDVNKPGMAKPLEQPAFVLRQMTGLHAVQQGKGMETPFSSWPKHAQARVALPTCPYFLTTLRPHDLISNVSKGNAFINMMRISASRRHSR